MSADSEVELESNVYPDSTVTPTPLEYSGFVSVDDLERPGIPVTRVSKKGRKRVTSYE